MDLSILQKIIKKTETSTAGVAWLLITSHTRTRQFINTQHWLKILAIYTKTRFTAVPQFRLWTVYKSAEHWRAQETLNLTVNTSRTLNQTQMQPVCLFCWAWSTDCHGSAWRREHRLRENELDYFVPIQGVPVGTQMGSVSPPSYKYI